MAEQGVMNKQQVELYEALMGEVLVFNLLSRIFYQEPDREWIQSTIEQDVFSDAPFASNQPEMQTGLKVIQDWIAQNEGSLSGDAFGSLQSDYTKLFLGPGKLLAAPWESVYLSEERLTFQESTLQVRNWYRRFGLVSERLYAEPDDHIGLELSFLAHLALQAVHEFEGNNEAGAQSLLEAQKNFLNEHLLVWAGEWCALVVRHASSPFFQGAARLVRGALAELAATHGLSDRKSLA